LAMDRVRKIQLLAQQIEDARNGQPEDFDLWRQRTEVVLRNVVGDANPLYTSFGKVKYTLSAWTSSTPKSAFDQARIRGVRQAIAVLEAAKIEVDLSGGTPEPSSGAIATGTAVFIVHGRDEARKHEVARFLRSSTGREPVILHEQSNSGRTVIEKFEEHASQAAYAVVIATGDDLGRAVDEQTDRPRARQNVIFELGFFFGALGRSKVALLYVEEVERPSDIDGLVRISLDAAGAWKMLLARELDSAGIGIDWTALR
jgi:predicted nucleotide-binding protein